MLRALRVLVARMVLWRTDVLLVREAEVREVRQLCEQLLVLGPEAAVMLQLHQRLRAHSARLEEP